MPNGTQHQLALFGGGPTCEAPGCDRELFRFGKGKWRMRFCSVECISADRRAREAARYAADPEWRALRIARETDRYRREGDRIRARASAYREANADEIRRREREKYRQDPSLKRASALRWARENPDAANAIKRRRRALKAKADARVITQRDLRHLEQRQRGCCVYCGERKPLTIEHLIPLSRGGRDSIGNYALACKSCNCSKGNLLVMEYRLKRPRIVRRRSA